LLVKFKTNYFKIIVFSVASKDQKNGYFILIAEFQQATWTKNPLAKNFWENKTAICNKTPE
jgi:hypothetical protein